MDGLAWVQDEDGKIGFINKKGEIVIACQYIEATYFSEGLAFVVSEGGFPTCINHSGEVVFTLDAVEFVGPFSEGLAPIISEDAEVGFVNTQGEVVIVPQFDEVGYFKEGLASVCLIDEYGFIDKTGKIVINPQFDWVGQFSNGLAPFEKNGKCGFIDKTGKIVINPQFDWVGQFSSGLAAFEKNDEYGFIDKDGKIVINPQFDNVGQFSNGLAPFKKNGEYGYIDKTGKIVINPQFDDAESFYDNVAIVALEDEYGIIDQEGKYIVNPQFEDLWTPDMEVSIPVVVSRLSLMGVDGFEYLVELQFVENNYIAPAKPVTDIDGNEYKTVKLGNQVWMAENLRTTRYADGTPIPLGTEASSTTAYRYYPDDNSANVSDYGYLYNWAAVMNGSLSSEANPSGVQGICPDGWHVPSDAEWTELENYVKSQSQYVCGSSTSYIAKALASEEGWNSYDEEFAVGYNPDANNATGFSACPAGDYRGPYDNFGDYAIFWSATQGASDNAYYRILNYYNAIVYRNYDSKYYGYSVRCVRD